MPIAGTPARNSGPWPKWKLEIPEQLSAVFLGASILIITFFRSTMGSNDLGVRGALPAQFFLLLPAVRMFERYPDSLSFTAPLRPRAVSAVYVCVALGLLATAYDWAGTRFHHLAVTQPGPDMPPFRYQIRAAYDFVDKNTPRTAINQHNPDRAVAIPYGVYGERQVVASDWFHGQLFAIDPAFYARIASDVGRLFAPGAPPGLLREITARYQIAAVVVDSTDPVWADPQSWVWRTPPDFVQTQVRVCLMHRIEGALCDLRCLFGSEYCLPITCTVRTYDVGIALPDYRDTEALLSAFRTSAIAAVEARCRSIDLRGVRHSFERRGGKRSIRGNYT
jgi:hypothetical protein